MNPSHLRMNDTIKERPLPSIPGDDFPHSLVDNYQSEKITQSEIDKLFKSNAETIHEEWEDLKKEIGQIKNKLDLVLDKLGDWLPKSQNDDLE